MSSYSCDTSDDCSGYENAVFNGEIDQEVLLFYGFPFRETINYPGWVTFVDGHIEEIISAFRFCDNYIEITTATGGQYSYEITFKNLIDREGMGIILPTPQFSKFEKGKWLDTDDICAFSFDTNSVKED